MVTPSDQARTRHSRRREDLGEEEEEEEDEEDEDDDDSEEEDDDSTEKSKGHKRSSGGSVRSKGSKKTGKSRRELPPGAVTILKQWLLSAEHFTHPYPTAVDQANLMAATGIDKKQLKNWFTNARRRIWKPMMKKQLEAANKTMGYHPHHHHHHHPHAQQVMGQAMASHNFNPMSQPFSMQSHHTMGPPMGPPSHLPQLQMDDFFKPSYLPTESTATSTAGTSVSVGGNNATASGSPTIPQPSMHPLMKTFSSKSFGNFRTASFTDFPRTDSYAFLEVFFNDEGLEGLSNEPLETIGLCMDEGENSPSDGQGASSSVVGLKRNIEKTGSNGVADSSEQNGVPQAKRVSGHITFGTPVPAPENGSQSQGAGPFNQPVAYYQPFKPFQGQMGQGPMNQAPAFGAPAFSTGGETGGQQQQQQQQPQQQQMSSGAVHVSSASRCPFCPELNVDTQLRPCGHLFHGHCLKPWIQDCPGAPLCPVCQVPISSCVLAVPCIYPGGNMSTTAAAQQGQQQQQTSSPNAQHQQVATIKVEQAQRYA